MSELLKAMANLTEEEQALVLKIIKGMDSNTEAVENIGQEDKTPLQPPKRTQRGKRGASRGSRNAQNNRLDNRGQGERQAQPSNPRPRSGPVGRKGRAAPQPARKGANPGHPKGGKGKGVQCRNEAVQLSGRNEFLNMEEKNEAQEDRDFDRKVSKGRRPTKRYRAKKLVEVACQGTCGYLYEVSPDVLMIDPDTREYLYTCNDCSVRR